MVRTIRWSVAVAFVASAGVAGAQQVTAPTPPRTDVNPRASASAPMSPAISSVKPTVLAPNAFGPGTGVVPVSSWNPRAYIVEQPVGVRRVEPAKDRSVPTPGPGQTKQNEAMMIVGGVALIVGAIIGDTPGQIIMIGGAGIGLYGLYQYLQ